MTAGEVLFTIIGLMLGMGVIGAWWALSEEALRQRSTVQAQRESANTMRCGSLPDDWLNHIPATPTPYSPAADEVEYDGT